MAISKAPVATGGRSPAGPGGPGGEAPPAGGLGAWPPEDTARDQGERTPRARLAQSRASVDRSRLRLFLGLVLSHGRAKDADRGGRRGVEPGATHQPGDLADSGRADQRRSYLAHLERSPFGPVRNKHVHVEELPKMGDGKDWRQLISCDELKRVRW